MSKNNKSNTRGKKIGLSILCVVLTLILVALIFTAVFVERKFGMLNTETNPTVAAEDLAALVGNQTKPAELADGRVPATVPTVPTQAAEIIETEAVVNILLVGQDEGGTLSDTMILCTVNPNTHEIHLTSFLRDSYVDIPGKFPHKLNTSYALGGLSLLNETLTYNFGIPIDGNVVVTFDAFRQVIDAIGGVELELSEDEAWYLNRNFGCTVDAGLNTLSGYQALGYSRIREEALGGDYNRTLRQRNLISALIMKAKSMSLMELNDMLNIVLPYISTDMTMSQITNYMVDLFPVVLDATITTQQIPTDETSYMDWVEQDGGMSIIRIDDFEANRAILQEIMGN